MIYILLESRDNLINPVLPKILDKVHISCQARVTKETTYETIKSYKQSPLLSAGWLLRVSKDITDSQLRLLDKLPDNTILLFHVVSRRELTDLQDKLDTNKVQYTLLDNYKISKEDIIKYIATNLHLSEQDAKYLAKRQGYYTVSVVNSVRVLKQFTRVDRDIIRKYTSVNDNVTLYEIVNYLFKLPDCKINYSTAVKLVYQYRFAFDHIRNYILSTCVLYRQIFDYMVDGQLTIKNYKSVKSSLDKKLLQSLSDYQLRQIVSHFSDVSLEYLYLIEQMVSSIPDDTSGIPAFINLLKLIK